MSNSECKSKMICIRLSQAEYELLKSQYQMHGARNISDLARLALQRILNGSDDRPDDGAARWAQLDDRVQALESQRR